MTNLCWCQHSIVWIRNRSQSLFVIQSMDWLKNQRWKWVKMTTTKRNRRQMRFCVNARHFEDEWTQARGEKVNAFYDLIYVFLTSNKMSYQVKNRFNRSVVILSEFSFLPFRFYFTFSFILTRRQVIFISIFEASNNYVNDRHSSIGSLPSTKIAWNASSNDVL